MTKPVAETSEWKKCPDCGRENSIATWEKLGKCPNCGGFPDRDNINPAIPAPAPSSKPVATIENSGPDGYARIVRLCDVSEFTSGTLLYAASKLAATAERELPPELPSDPQRMLDLIRYMRHELSREGLISEQEYAMLVSDSDNGKRVARLESYDEFRLSLTRMQERIEELEKSNIAWDIHCAELLEEMRKLVKK